MPYEHLPHPHISRRQTQGPIKIADQHPTGGYITRFNTKLALIITRIVGSMWCAYVFAAFDCISLPTAIHLGSAAIVSWIAQTFLQLVLLSIIMVGQNVQAQASDARAEQTFEDASAALHEALEIQAHLLAQDAVIEKILTHLQSLGSSPPEASS
jgi:hypothetical protein